MNRYHILREPVLLFLVGALPEYLSIRDDPRFCHHFVRGRSGDYPGNGGFDTFWKKAVSAGQDWYIVYVGPFIDLNSAKVNLKA